jgi:hypothetical protein
MTAESSSGLNLQSLILFQSQRFLLQLQAGAGDELLTALLLEILRQESKLIKEERLMLHPRMWKILFNRYINRRNREIIDTLN